MTIRQFNLAYTPPVHEFLPLKAVLVGIVVEARLLRSVGRVDHTWRILHNRGVGGLAVGKGGNWSRILGVVGVVLFLFHVES